MSDQLYVDVRFKFIIRPLKAKNGSSFDRWVTKDSPKWQRNPIVQIRRYQAMECHDGINWDTSEDGWRFTQVYTFVDYFPRSNGEDFEALVGAVGFSKYEERCMLDFCWLHPFKRHKGLLRHAWPEFVARFDKFTISSPISAAMRHFLISVNWDANTTD